VQLRPPGTGRSVSDTFGSGNIFSGWLAPQITRDLSRAGAVGHICGHHFDAAGRHIPHELCQRIMSVPLERLKDIPTVVGVACRPQGPRHQRALRGHHIDVLITDTATAQAVLSGTAETS
jgi:deoxyribonucleoside regulator